jgi:hypothetical protein
MLRGTTIASAVKVQAVTSYPFGHTVQPTGNRVTDFFNQAKEAGKELGEVAVVAGALLLVPATVLTGIAFFLTQLRPRKEERPKPPRLKGP